MDSSLPGLEVSSESMDCCGVLTLRGEVDIATAPLLHSHIEGLTGNSAEHLLFECQALGFIDSSGIHVLELARQAVDSGVGLVRPTKPVRRLLEIAGLSMEYPAFNTIEEAREYLHSRRKRQFSAGA